VLHDIDLAVARGAVGLVGLNGHGQDDAPALGRRPHDWRRGEIELDGKSIGRTPAHKLARAGVADAQGDALFPGLSVRDNLDSGASPPAGENGAAARSGATALPRLAGRLGQSAGTLSGGERRMCSLGRGLMSDARVYLIDEPRSALPRHRRRFVFDLRSSDAGVVRLILAEQNQTLLEGWIDRIVQIHGGRSSHRAGRGVAERWAGRRRETDGRRVNDLVTTINLAAIYGLLGVGISLTWAGLGSQPRPRRHVRCRLRRLVGAEKNISISSVIFLGGIVVGRLQGDHLPERLPAARRSGELGLPLDGRLARASRSSASTRTSSSSGASARRSTSCSARPSSSADDDHRRQERSDHRASVVMILLVLALVKSRIGLGVRALTQNPEGVASSGIGRKQAASPS
jgi:branched-chain amino acid transport system ATP-binding protein